MLDIEKEELREEIYKVLKEVGFVPEMKNQTLLVHDELELDSELKEFMSDKQCLVWLKSTKSGETYNVACNQVYVSNKGSLKVVKPLPFSFEEVFHIWECYFKGRSIEDIYWTLIFDAENVGLSDVKLVLWALLNGRFNHILEFINEDRYDFDFKKYTRRY